MRKIIATEFISLDGVVEGPGGEPSFEHSGWTMAFFNEEAGAYKLEELRRTGALLLGRNTYQGFAFHWPGRTDDAGFADRFNTMPKHVVSSTTRKLDWQGSELLTGDLAEAIRKLKAEDGQDVYIHGSITLARSLFSMGLLDEIHLMVFPIVLGKGIRLFDGARKRVLTLLESKSFSTGVQVMHYAVNND